MTKSKKNSINLLKPFVLFLFFCVMLALVISISRLIFDKFLISSVSVIEVKPDPTLIRASDLDFLKNKNIFDIDLRDASLHLSNKYPQFASVRLYKRFPDKIIVELNSRNRFVQVKVGQTYCIVDRDFIIISKEVNLVPNLIEVRGVKARSAALKIASVKSRQEKLASSIINFFDKNRQYPKIICVDVSSLPDIKLVLQNSTVVIISTNDFNEKIKLLLYVLPKIKSDAEKIGYIDLRFKEPVISYKEK